MTWNWRATNENPYYEDDKTETLADYYPCNDNLLHFTYKNWLFGTDNTGNICDSINIRFLIEKCKDIGKVTLITADGSLNTHLGDPNEKEKSLYVFQYSELVAGLSILADGGNFVWKVFTLFNANNICLLYLLNSIFGKITLFKPLSCPLNSFELYVVCQNFNKQTNNLDKLLEKMLSNIGNESSIFPKEFIPEAFLKNHLKSMESFASAQNEAIRKFMMLRNNPRGMESKKYLSTSESAALDFIRYYNISPLQSRDRLTPVDNSINAFSKLGFPFELQHLALSLNEINSFEVMDFMQRKRILKSKLSELSRRIRMSSHELELPKLNTFILTVIQGKPIENVTRSMFIAPTFIHKMSVVIEKCFRRCLLELSTLNVKCSFDNSSQVNFKFLQNYGKSERGFLRAVLKVFFQQKPNQIIFEKFYFITHFSASVLAFLALFYNDCVMNSSGDIILKAYSHNGFLKEIKMVEEIHDSDRFDAIFSLMQPSHIQRSDFAVQLIKFNSVLMLAHMENFTSSL